MTGRSIALFALVAQRETGGAWPVRQEVAERRGWPFVGPGVIGRAHA